MKKSIVIWLFVLLLIVGFVGDVSAQKVVAKLRGGRMILRLDQGESMRKSITVINDNDIKMKIEISASGDLADRIELEEDSFELEAGSEKNAFFRITAPNEAETTESNINVKYIPVEGDGNGFGLSATVIVITSDKKTDEIDDVSSSPDGISGLSFVEKVKETNAIFISTFVLLVILIAFIIYALNTKGKKKRSRRPRE